VQTYPKELMQCMLEMSSQTADDPYYQRIVHLVKALVRTSLRLFILDYIGGVCVYTVQLSLPSFSSVV